jgi:hypothetical protein
VNPDKIRQAIARRYPSLVAEQRKDGWAFYLSPPQKGARSNRIIRVSRSSPTSVTRLKLAVSSRHCAQEAGIEFTGDESALRKHVDHELQLFDEHFAEGGETRTSKTTLQIRPSDFTRTRWPHVMSVSRFQPSCWANDIAALGPAHRELAEEAFTYARDTLGCAPYHRASKAEASSDRQTLLRHPRTQRVCLVLSVVPNVDDKRTRVLRIDFFDIKEHVGSFNCGTIHRAPRTQWTEKGERRLVVSRSAEVAQLRAFLAAVIACQ